MKTNFNHVLSRRGFVQALAGTAASAFLRPASAAGADEHQIRIARGTARLTGAENPSTAVWTYNGAVPGPMLRLRQGKLARIIVENGLDEDTTVHWHGIRLQNAMDGVPGLTQPPIT